MRDFLPAGDAARGIFAGFIDMGSGVPMARRWGRLAACMTSSAVVLVLNGCGAQPDDGYSTPPPSSYGSTPQADLSGGPTPPTRRRAAVDDSGLAGGPAASSQTYAGMAPVANPADMPYDQCMKIYGPGKCGGAPRGGARPAQVAYGEPAPRYSGAPGTMAPIANPEDMSPAERRRVYPGRYAARAATAPARRRYAPPAYAPPPAPSYAAAAKPAQTTAYAPPPAPTPAPKPAQSYAQATPPAPPPSAPMTPGDKLSTAVKAEAVKGATLTVPDALSKGQAAKVTLTLPQDLMGIIQREAAKLGLTRQARKAEVSATLTGQGYEIDPSGKQTKPLKAGEATSFDWQVKPGAGAKSPLRADVDGALTGKGQPVTFSLGSLEQAIAGTVDKAKTAAKGFTWPHFSLDSLNWPGMPTLDMGGVKAKTGNITAGLLALLALLIGLGVARSAGASRARAERRRKFRTMTDYGRNEMEAETAPAASSDSHGHDSHGHDDHGHGYVNPMIAAAGGAALGAAAAHAHDEHHGHDDHGHDAHAHDDHGHDAHGHDAHGHDDHHGHGGGDAHAADGHGDHGHDHGGHDAHGGHDHDHHASHTSHDGHGHDDHGAGAHAADGHGEHGHDAHGHDDHGHDDHGHDDHGHGHDDHAAGGHHDDGHGAPATLVSSDGHGHDDHGHGDHGTDAHAAGGHDDHGHADHHDDGHHGDDHHGEEAHGHHGHDDHAHDHHREPEHA